VLTSPPLSEYARLVNKVSHNLGANLFAPLMAVARGQRTYAAGMEQVRDYLVREIGIASESFTLPNASGAPEDAVTPHAQTSLLREIARRPDAKDLVTSMPVIGVDGSLADEIPRDDPAVGHIRAKTGTLVGPVDGRPGLMTKALAGYIDARSGRKLVFALYLNDVPGRTEQVSDAIDMALRANEQLGRIAATIHGLY